MMAALSLVSSDTDRNIFTWRAQLAREFESEQDRERTGQDRAGLMSDTFYLQQSETETTAGVQRMWLVRARLAWCPSIYWWGSWSRRPSPAEWGGGLETDGVPCVLSVCRCWRGWLVVTQAESGETLRSPPASWTLSRSLACLQHIP